MCKSAIIKSKDSGLVCLVSEMEKPKITNKETLKELLKWQHSVKEYSIRDEDKEEFRKLAFESYCNKPKHNTIEQALSEGISIDPNLVGVKHIIMGNGPCGLNFATLKPTIKESLQVESDAVEKHAIWRKVIEDDEIAKEAKNRYPYLEDDTDARINKKSSKRRRFIEGAKWMQFELFNGNI